MDARKTGTLIRAVRSRLGLTQRMLGDLLHVSDKTISKWERGCGGPEVSLLPGLAQCLGITVEALLRGELEENTMSNGNLKKMRFFVCPLCGNLICTTDEAEIRCCGQMAPTLVPRKADDAHAISAEVIDDQWYLSAGHEMSKVHYLTFVAFLTGDTLILKKQYPEWDLSTRLPYLRHGILLWHCSQHGLFYRVV